MTIWTIKTDGVGLSDASLRLIQMIASAAQMNGGWDKGKVPLDGKILDQEFEAIHKELSAFTDHPDYKVAAERVDILWSRAFACNVRLDSAVNPAEVYSACIDAQTAACWACGDGDKV